MSEPLFSAVQTQIKFPAIEEEILKFWKEQNIFEKSLELTSDKDAFVFYDGPPFATGLPHYGHLLAGTLKDIIPRYWTMQGHYIERRFGWDAMDFQKTRWKSSSLRKKRHRKLGIYIFNEACLDRAVTPANGAHCQPGRSMGRL